MAAVAAARLRPRAPHRSALRPRRLRAPRLRPGLVERPRLLARLDALTQGQLTLVAAPMGYGKTTLLASWAASEARPVAWASLAPTDAEPTRFWALVAAALGQAVPSPALGLRPVPAAALPPAERAALLAAALGALDGELVLVLDDYQHAAGRPVERSFERFLELLPETVHVVLSSRDEPALSLALRRSRGALGELRADDLRLDTAETIALVARTGGVTLDEADALELERRTEGWPAGIYLAALAVRTSQRPSELASSFSGAAREVADYLRAELLDVQPGESVRTFLLATSVLEQLSAPVCDLLLRRDDSQALLDALARSGSFLVPLDGSERAFRLRRPAAEFLRAELARVEPDGVVELHRRAAAACERAGLFEEASAHARAAGDERESLAIASRHAHELVRAGGGLERTTAVAADLEALLDAAARAARTYALLLGGRPRDAYELGSEPPSPVVAASAAAAQAAAVASLAAGRLGLRAAAAPLSRSAAAAIRTGAVRRGLATALAALAEAAVLEAQGETSRAELRCEAAAADAADDPPARALALLALARLRGGRDRDGALELLRQAREEAVAVAGADLLEVLAGEVESGLESCAHVQPASRELSAAERRVLRLLATSLTRREIAGELYLSFNTVKTHARVIYRKLGVSSRQAAVRVAHELNLV
jgi:LuxR family maltose regulon positive regulatory protein